MHSSLLMLGGDRGILRGKKGAFWYTLQELRKHWERIDVFCPPAPTKESVQIEFDGDGAAVWFHPNPGSLWTQKNWIVRKGSALLKENPAIITTHAFPPFYALKGGLVLQKKFNLPLCMELHGLAGYPHVQSIREWLEYQWSKCALPPAVRQANALRIVNPTVKTKLLEWDVDPAKIHLVPAIYLDMDLIDQIEEKERSYDVCFCGRLDENKGIMRVLEAVNMHPDCSLIVMGEGPQRVQAEKYVQEHALQDRVTFAGWISEQEEIFQALKKAKIFIMASRHEGGPRTAFEAMACGCAPIVTPVGLMPTLIADGENGLISDGSVDDLSKKIGELLSEEALREHLSARAKESVERFEKREAVKVYASFLQELE